MDGMEYDLHCEDIEFYEFVDSFNSYEEAFEEGEKRCKENGRTYYIKAPVVKISRAQEITVEEYEYV